MPAETSEAVVNTGPLIALAACGQLELLHALHSRVIVPQQVAAQIDRGKQLVDAIAVDLPSWVEILSLQTTPSRLLRDILDDGAAAVITLAGEVSVPLNNLS